MSLYSTSVSLRIMFGIISQIDLNCGIFSFYMVLYMISEIQ